MSLTATNDQRAVSSRNRISSDMSQAVSSGDPSPSGVEVTMDTSPAGAISPQNQTAADRPDGLMVVTDRTGDVKGPCSHADMAPDSADTARNVSTANRTDVRHVCSQR